MIEERFLQHEECFRQSVDKSTPERKVFDDLKISLPRNLNERTSSNVDKEAFSRFFLIKFS